MRVSQSDATMINHWATGRCKWVWGLLPYTFKLRSSQSTTAGDAEMMESVNPEGFRADALYWKAIADHLRVRTPFLQWCAILHILVSIQYQVCSISDTFWINWYVIEFITLDSFTWRSVGVFSWCFLFFNQWIVKPNTTLGRFTIT